MCGPSNDSRIYEQATGPLKYLGGAFPIASQVLDAQTPAPTRAVAPSPVPPMPSAPAAPTQAAPAAPQDARKASPLVQALAASGGMSAKPAVSGSPVSYTR